MSLTQHITSREGEVIQVANSVQVDDGNSGSSESCDCISYSYFILAFLLFAVGSLVTLVVLEEDEFGPLAKFWLVGPSFLCFGFIIAIKTLFYLRRKRFVEFMTRERYAHQQDESTWCNASSMPSIMSLPPSYDTVIAAPDTFVSSSTLIPSPPPSYREAIRRTDTDTDTRIKHGDKYAM